MQMQGFDGHPAYKSTWDCTTGTRRSFSFACLTESFRGSPNAHNGTYCIAAMWRDEGIRGFYRGMIPNYLKVVPSISITFLVYEWMKTVLDG
jgi:hypothetical protein